jgi:hypothetical protein
VRPSSSRILPIKPQSPNKIVILTAVEGSAFQDPPLEMFFHRAPLILRLTQTNEDPNTP